MFHRLYDVKRTRKSTGTRVENGNETARRSKTAPAQAKEAMQYLPIGDDEMPA